MHKHAQATDYEKIITNRMDILSVSRKLKNNRYPTVEAFFNDVFLVYDNAIRYYQQEGQFKTVDVYEAAKVCGWLFGAIPSPTC